MNRTIRQKYNKDVEDLNKAINQQDLTNIYKTIHSTKIEHTFFSSTYEIFSTVDHMLGHKTSLSKFIRTEFMELNREQIRVSGEFTNNVEIKQNTLK